MAQGLAPSIWPPWLLDVEDAHGQLQHAVCLIEDNGEDAKDLTSSARSIEAAFLHLYEAVDGRTADRMTALQTAETNAKNAAKDIAEQLESPGPLSDATKALHEAATALSQAAQHAPGLAPDAADGSKLKATRRGTPLHAMDRSSWTPRLRLPPPLLPADIAAPIDAPPTSSFEELDAVDAAVRAQVAQSLEERLAQPEPPIDTAPSLEADTLYHLSPESFVREKARLCFDEVAMLALQRKPLRGDHFTISDDVETRLIETVDAFASFGATGVGELETLVLDAPVAEPSRLFAASFIAGSLVGRDALGLIDRLARHQATTSEMRQAMGDALRLSRHPMLDLMLNRWRQESNVELRRIALEVLVARGAVSDAQLQQLSQDRPRIAALTLLPMATGGHPALEETLEQALQSDHPVLLEAAWVAQAFASQGRAARSLRRALDGAHGDRAARWLAIIGASDEDTKYIMQRAFTDPTEENLQTLGWLGAVGSVDHLIRLLARSEGDTALTIGSVLQRILGANLTAEVDIDPEKLLDPDPPEPKAEGLIPPPTLAREVSDPRHMPAEGSPDTLELSDPTAGTWRQWWDENRERFDPELRYRWGYPHSPLTCWAELDGALLPPSTREQVAREIWILTQQYTPFDTRDWVKQQQQTLAAWKPKLGG